MRWLASLSLFCVLFANQSAAQTLPPEVIRYADMILYNGKIVTMDDKSTKPTPGTIAEAVAIREGKILALGKSDDIRRYGGPNTATIDLKGKTVVPGLIDTHGHIHEYALEHHGPRLATEVRGKDIAEVKKTLAATLKDEAAKRKPGEWIAVDMRFPLAIDMILNNKLTKKELNRMAAKNPVLLVAHPAYLVNDTAIRSIEKFFGYRLTKEDLDREVGQPLQGTDFRRGLFWDVLMENRYEEQAEAVKKELWEWAAYGVTTYSSHLQALQALNVFTMLNERNQMPIRFAGTHRAGTQFFEGAPGFYRRLGNLAGVGGDYFWFVGSTPGGLDSGPPKICTSIKAPKEIKKHEHCRSFPGMSTRQMVFEVVRSGGRIAGNHVYGDLALDHMLDAIEEGSKAAGLTLEQIRAKRHGADHCGLNPRPDQIPRLQKLGIYMSCNGRYVDRTYPVLEQYGMEYQKWVVPAKSIIDAGVRMAFEIDSHGAQTYGAFDWITPFVTRKTRDGKPVAPEEKIDRVVALKAATIWAAEYVLRENVLGSLEKGKWADFLVLSKDYFQVPEDKISTIRPVVTIVGGKIVYLDRGLAKELGMQPIGTHPERLIRQIERWERG
ncbi:MAG: amidohydrolase family protein [Deltaproteobacteria bacterium]|nr:amidohydrolase family protein [Deltaproteobacteria bacterium]